MRTTLRLTLIALAPLVLAGPAGAKSAPPDKTQSTPSGIDETAIDRAVNPCDDFYTYACGGWMKRTPIPADKPVWHRSFNEIDERNETALRKILEGLAGGKSTEAYADKLGAFWTSCMDEAGITKTADADLKSLLHDIDNVKDLPSLAKQVARLQLSGAAPLFELRSQQDFKDATQMIALADQGGLGLPDRDYFLKDDARTKEIRAQYQQHVQKMLELAGETPADAAKDAQTVLRLEHRLAEVSMSRVDRRDPRKIYHRLERAGLIKKAPSFPWDVYFEGLGHVNVTQINVAVPDFFAGLSGELTKVPIADWRTYLRWHALHAAAPLLSNPFVDESFHFYGKVLQGIDKLEPRWKRCVKATDQALGEALARPFVKQYFGAEGKQDTQAVVKAIEAAMEANLKTLSWMDEPTRKAAFEKLHAIANQIGFPDKWRNYDKLDIKSGALLANAQRAAEFEHHRDLDKIGKPVDRGEWEMTPPTVNAYYEPSLNEMVFPAGILQSPFYSAKAAPPVNYGAIGMVMGHELTHGFDDEGRQFDGKGNLREWWTPKVGQEFVERAQCVVAQYDGYVSVDQEHVNGKLTLGENIADLGGIKLAHAAYRAQYPQAQPAVKTGGFSDDQLFYLGFAQAWCTNRRDEYARLRVKTDPHSPAQFRVNGPLSNLPDFAAAFGCKAGQKMVRTTACVIW